MVRATPTNDSDAMTTTDMAFPRHRSELSTFDRLGRESAYLLTGLPLAIISFVVLITGLALSTGLLIIWIGVPLAVATLVLGRWFAILERARMRAAGQPLPGATYRVGSGRWGWLVVLRDPQY